MQSMDPTLFISALSQPSPNQPLANILSYNFCHSQWCLSCVMCCFFFLVMKYITQWAGTPGCRVKNKEYKSPTCLTPSVGLCALPPVWLWTSCIASKGHQESLVNPIFVLDNLENPGRIVISHKFLEGT